MSKYLIENLFGIDGWNIAWYGVIIAVGMVLGVMLAIYRTRKQGLVTDSSLRFFPYAVYIDALEEWHQATFFYESMWNVHHFRNKGITSFVIAFDFGRDAALCGICPSQQNETYIFREICE